MATEPTNSGADASKPEAQQTTPDAEKSQASDGKTNTEPDAKTLTQQQIDDLVKREKQRVQKKADDDIAALRKEFEDTQARLKTYEEEKAQLEREREEKETEKLLQKGEYEKARDLERKQFEEKLKKEQAARADLEAKLSEREKRFTEAEIDRRLLSAFSDSVDPSAAVALFKKDHAVSLDPATLDVVVDGDAAAPLPQLASSFLAKRDYLAKSAFDGKSGGGSAGGKPSGTGAPLDPTKFDDPAYYDAHRDDILKAAGAKL